MSGGAWEAALELAFLYGWKPAGTNSPRTEAWKSRQAVNGAPVWDSQDYFSYESQRVGRADACALSQAILRAMGQIPDGGPTREDHRRPVGPILPSPIPSRASAIADGMSTYRRNVMRRFARFADSGGFTIDGES